MSSNSKSFQITASDGAAVFCRYWADVKASGKAVVQIAHGAAEHSARYERFAQFLNANGYFVYANDHRGHGHTRLRSKILGDAGPDGWNRMLSDARELTDLIVREHPGLPVVLFGHSMGSFLAQDYMARYPRAVAAVVLCATNGVFNPPAEALAAFEKAAQQDPLGPSKIFSERWATYNHQFTPGQAGFDWLSRDAAEVEKYVDDPACGFPFTNELARDFIFGLRDLFLPEREAKIPRDMPILVIAGDKDPVGGNTKTIAPLLDRYKTYGMTQVSVKFYRDARHELLNEINRDEVQRDVLAWLDSVL